MITRAHFVQFAREGSSVRSQATVLKKKVLTCITAIQFRVNNPCIDNDLLYRFKLKWSFGGRNIDCVYRFFLFFFSFFFSLFLFSRCVLTNTNPLFISNWPLSIWNGDGLAFSLVTKTANARDPTSNFLVVHVLFIPWGILWSKTI